MGSGGQRVKAVMRSAAGPACGVASWAERSGRPASRPCGARGSAGLRGCVGLVRLAGFRGNLGWVVFELG